MSPRATVDGIVDSHVHCGVQNVRQPWELVRRLLDDADIEGACLFAPVEDVYDRSDPSFVDDPWWIACRARANDYLLEVQAAEPRVNAYYFVWNDFPAEELGRGFRGVKWHRHGDEPVYRYDDPRCEAFLQEVYRLDLPVVLEETFPNTLAFLARVDGRAPVIIPHMGALNGGFGRLLAAGVWDRERVYADTALASPRELERFLDRYGHDRLLFGSDFPFGSPASELSTILGLGLSRDELSAVLRDTVTRLVRGPGAGSAGEAARRPGRSLSQHRGRGSG